ncbi:MAG: histidine kinase [Bacteroidota bacterium]
MKYRNPYRALPFPAKYLFILAGVIAILLTLQRYTEHLIFEYDFDFSWFNVAGKFLAIYLLWAMLAPLLFYLAARFQMIKRQIFQRILTHIFIGCLVAFTHQVAAIKLLDLALYFKNGFMRSLFSQWNLVALGTGVFSSFLHYWVIIALFWAMIYYKRLVSKEKELVDAQLNALIMQLRPHFLFNTLHSISSLIDHDAKGAQKMLSRLGVLLRGILERDDEQIVSLEKEMDYLKNYLEIEQVRFQDRLRIDYHVQKEALTAQVPYLILQPLVENALKHGLAGKIENGVLTLSARVLDQNTEGHSRLELTVEDNGGVEVSKNNRKKRRGIGLSNIRNRLSQLYKDNFTFDLSVVKDERSVARIVIPLETVNHHQI